MVTQDNIAACVSTVVVTHNSASVIGDCLDALNAMGLVSVVVDNASSDDSVAIAEQKGANVLSLERNIGFGKGMNAGAGISPAPYCLLINPDVTITSEALGALLDVALSNLNAVIVAPKIIEPDGQDFLHNPILQQGYQTIVSSACMLVQRDWFLDIGGFDPNLFLFYEDEDLCRRAWHQGREVLVVPEAKISRLCGKSVAPSFAHTYTIRFHQAWSRRYICRKYGLPDPARKLSTISFFKLLMALLTFQRMRTARYLGSLMGNIL